MIITGSKGLKNRSHYIEEFTLRKAGRARAAKTSTQGIVCVKLSGLLTKEH